VKWLIYKHTSTISGKSYIGLTSLGLCRRWQMHCSRARNKSLLHFHNAIRKYGELAWRSEVLHDNILTLDNAAKLEVFYINKFNTFQNGYNLTIGGEKSPVARIAQEFKFYNPELNLIEVATVPVLVSLYNLNKRAVYNLTEGAANVSGGWYLYGNYRPATVYTFINITNSTREYCTAKDFIRNHSELYRDSILRLISGRYTSYKGWQIETR